MTAEGNLRSKILYKLFLFGLKITPALWAIIVAVSSVVAYFGIHSELISAIAGVSLIPWLSFIMASFVFRFCICHRLYLYYVGIVESISWYDYKIGLPLTDFNYLVLNILLTIILISIITVWHVRNSKKFISTTTG